MKKFTLFIISAVTGFAATAQDPTPAFESLKLNSSPAFVMLGVEPENLQRPSSPKQFIAGIQNAIVNDKLKPNVAIEATPYYWKNPVKDPQRFDHQKYLVGKKDVWRTIAETFSLSLGTSESDTVVFGKLDAGTAAGTGIRFTIVDGKPARPNLVKLASWNKLLYRRAILQSIADKMATADDGVSKEAIIRESISEAEKNTGQKGLYHIATAADINEATLAIRMDLINKMTLADTEFKKEVESLLEQANAQEKAILSELNKEKVPFAKNGFILEFAAGSAFVFQNNKWSGFEHAKTGIWLTPSYRWQVNKDGQTISLLDLIGVVRLSFNNQKDSVDVANYFDAGIKLQYTHNRLSIAAEGVYRHASELPDGARKKYTYRLVSSLDYKITETITFKFSFGTNFDGNTATYSDPKKMFAVGGLNFGIFNGKEK